MELRCRPWQLTSGLPSTQLRHADAPAPENVPFKHLTQEESALDPGMDLYVLAGHGVQMGTWEGSDSAAYANVLPRQHLFLFCYCSSFSSAKPAYGTS